MRGRARTLARSVRDLRLFTFGLMLLVHVGIYLKFRLDC